MYLSTAKTYPSLEDEAEFILATVNFGLPHPPGFPLFILLAKPFTWLPFASDAFCIHIFTSLLAVSSLYLVKRLCLKISNSELSAQISVLMLGSSLFFWSQANTAEVYLLNTFMWVLLYNIALSMNDNINRKKVIIFSFLYGLSLSNHWPLMILVSISFVPIIWSKRDYILENIIYAFIAFFAGLSPYIYLLLASYFSDFLFLHPIDSTEKFFSYLMRQEYARNDQVGSRSIDDKFRMMGSFLNFIAVQFYYIGLVPFTVGLFRLFHSKKKILLSFLAAFLSSSLLLLLVRNTQYGVLSVEILASYQLIPIVVAAIIIAVGLQSMLTNNAHNRFLMAGLCFIAIIWTAVSYNRADNYIDSFAKDYADAILQSLPNKSVLLVAGDSEAGSLGYAIYSKKTRPDITINSSAAAFFPNKIFNRNLDIPKKSHYRKIIQYIEDNLAAGRRVFAIKKISYFEEDKSVKFPFSYVDYGVYSEIVPTKKTAIFDDSLLQSFTSIANKYVNGDYSQRWKYHRESLISGICHMFLINNIDNLALTKIETCALNKARYYHVYKKDYEKASQVYLQLIASSNQSSIKTRSLYYKEYTVTRVKMLNKNLRKTGQMSKEIIRSIMDINIPFIHKHNICDNQAALNTYELALQLNVAMNWDFYNKHYAECPWSRKLKKYL